MPPSSGVRAPPLDRGERAPDNNGAEHTAREESGKGLMLLRDYVGLTSQRVRTKSIHSCDVVPSRGSKAAFNVALLMLTLGQWTGDMLWDFHCTSGGEKRAPFVPSTPHARCLLPIYLEMVAAGVFLRNHLST